MMTMTQLKPYFKRDDFDLLGDRALTPCNQTKQHYFLELISGEYKNAKPNTKQRASCRTC